MSFPALSLFSDVIFSVVTFQRCTFQTPATCFRLLVLCLLVTGHSDFRSVLFFPRPSGFSWSVQRCFSITFLWSGFLP
ncbi:uncharacterized protein GGS25DRAFT_470375 [Hypoxylon fragiforme]|uniref:uncharacterized protein n=1 Tax=Hypoxylon fragiforme TaxID=63214 RepID=UPI0020C612E1|nr:uncharacterized protein GGS25DRAFT_470375 [Hypoxylon fragiforme]KAI2614113.1 hypothetical protein GGS25DRAFT_470375 [Hypoxylon fragiforme]